MSMRRTRQNLPLAHELLTQHLTAVGFEPTPLRNGALSHRLRPLGQTVLGTMAEWLQIYKNEDPNH